MIRSLLLLSVLFAPLLGATTALKLDLDALVDNSTRIVVGKVGQGQARWDDARTGIWTWHAVTVSETLKGDAGNSLDIAIRGGAVGEVAQHVAGAGNLESGSEYLLFLWRDDDGRWRLTGMVQGAFILETRDKVKYARSSLNGLTILDPQTLQPVANPVALDLTLDDARRRIAARVKAANAEAAK